MDGLAKGQLLGSQTPAPQSWSKSQRDSPRRTLAAALSIVFLFSFFGYHFSNPSFFSSFSCHHAAASHESKVAKAQQCAIDNLKADTWFLDNAVPIKSEEFLERRDRLAKALAINGVDAFVLEPGYTFQ
jgi:hypothetical protein